MKTNYKKIGKKVLLIAILVCLTIWSNAVNYYVSNLGNDASDGKSPQTAWKTLTKVNATTFLAGDQILFERGSVFYGTIAAKNSGNSTSPVTYSAYGAGANPIVTGFTTITSGWTNEGGGIYSTIITSEAQTNMVTIDGVQYGMGRYPNSTFLTYESAVSNTSITDNQLTGTPNWTGAEALIYKNGYRIERSVISNHSGGTLSYSSFSGPNASASAPSNYFIQNDLKTLDQYGEWFHDTATGKFYMFFGAVDPSSKIVKVATLNNLIKVTTAKTYITINGLELTGSIKAGFMAEYNCHNLTIQNTTFSFIGSDGVYIDGQYATINNSTFNYCNRISIMTKGANATISNNSVSNNAVLLGQGNYGYSGTSAIVVLNDNATVTGNNVQNTATNGIFVDGTVDNGLIKNNYIYNTCLHNWDHGSIYTTQMYTALTIEGNVIEKSKGTGIYLDAIGGHITAKNNSVTGCEHSGIHIHSQSYDEIFDNIIYNCGSAVFIQNTSGLNDSHDVKMYNNIFVAKSANQVTLRYYSDYAGYASSFPTYSLYNNIYARPINDVSSFYYLGGNKTLAQWQSFSGLDATSKKSPVLVGSESDLQFEYNTTGAAKTVTLSRPMLDMKGTKYPSSITLQPFTSVVLMKDNNPGATSFTLTGPTSGNVNTGTANFTVTPNSPYTGTITITPSGTASAGLVARVLTFSNSSTAQTFTFMPTVAGSIILTPSNNGSLTNPAVLTYNVNAVAPGSPTSVIAVAGNSSATVSFVAPANNGGSAITGYTVTANPAGGIDANAGTTSLSRTITGLTNGTAYTFTVKATSSAGTSVASAVSNSVVPLAPIDNTPPVVSSFLMPTSAKTLSVPVSGFVATDNVGVTGYLITDSPTAPLTNNAGWSATPPLSYEFSSAGTYTLYAWAKDETGNVSVPKSQMVSIALETKQGSIAPSHFIPVWYGENGLNHMNLMVVSATLEDIPLSVNDEIAVFSGSLCVGSAKLALGINPEDLSTYLTISASQNDGANNGFTDNDTIIFKIWDNQNQKEMIAKAVKYRNEIPAWLTNGKYVAGGTSVVEIVSYNEFTQSITLVKGYNMVSTYLEPKDSLVCSLTKPLVDDGTLLKVQDESGNSYENWGTFGGWINKVGSVKKTEGYKIKVTTNCTLQVTGRPIALPLDIYLKAGWNIISFPRTDLIDALSIVKPLIDQNKLVKVQDEKGNSIEDWGIFGGWKNGIGNFVPGKAYKVKMSADAILTIHENYTKSALILADVAKTGYFISDVEGNGTDHMNINMVELREAALNAGDELAAFDGDICVGTLKLTENHIYQNSASLVASLATEENSNSGFKPGNKIRLFSWSTITGNESEIQMELVKGQLSFEKNSSVFARLKSLTTSNSGVNSVQVSTRIYPNPSKGHVTISFSELPQSGSKLEVLDPSGKRILSRAISGMSEELNLEQHPAGIYFVKSIVGSKEEMHKLILN